MDDRPASRVCLLILEQSVETHLGSSLNGINALGTAPFGTSQQHHVSTEPFRGLGTTSHFLELEQRSSFQAKYTELHWHMMKGAEKDKEDEEGKKMIVRFVVKIV